MGTLRLNVLHTPGHTPGHVTFYEPTARAAFDGDVLFQQGIGRTDSPGGSAGQLMESIQNKLFTLPDDTVIYPGHGPFTTVGEEEGHNPFLQRVSRYCRWHISNDFSTSFEATT